MVFRVFLCAGFLGIAAVDGGQANPLTLSKAQQALIDGRLSNQFQATRLRGLEAEEQRRKVFEIGHSGDFRSMARAAATRNQIPVSLFERLVTVESNWKPRAVSEAGAIGLAQLMPGTARILGVDPWDPKQNLDGGARYLRQQFVTFRDWKLALAAYNAGPEAVKRHGGVPPYRETRAYVRKILGP